jgi:hypothetical protein
MKWLLEQQCDFFFETSTQAAKAGHLHILRFLHTIGCAIDSSASEAAAKLGAVDILQWLDECGITWRKSGVYAAAASSGNMQLILWMAEKQAKFNYRSMAAAAEYGHLEICKHLRSIGCDWNVYVYRASSMRPHNDHVSKWLHDNGCPYSFSNGLSSDSDG